MNTKTLRIYDKEYPSLLKYPFKSKYKYLDSVYKESIPKEPFVKDFKLKSCKALSKPNFSYEPGCYEVDLMFIHFYSPDTLMRQTQIYLIMINVNTRYLIVEPINDKSTNEIGKALARIVQRDGFDIKTIKCDGEKGFEGLRKNCVVIHLKPKPDENNNDNDNNNNKKRKVVKRNTNAFKKSLSEGNNEYVLIFDLESHIHNYERNEVKRATIRDDIINNTNQNDRLIALKNVLQTKYSDVELIDDFNFIKFVINDSPYALAHKTVDSVIRTLRNAFGLDNRRLADYNLMRQMVNYYNNTPHKSLRFKNFEYNFIGEYDSGLEKPTKYVYYTPSQLQHNIELEWKYIRMMKMKLREINEKQLLKGLLTYQPGNILLVHVDQGKTVKKHEKRRRVFNEIAEFIKYANGNVICKLLKPYENYRKTKVDNESVLELIPSEKNQKIEVPIIYTKFVCKDISKLNDDYKNYFGL